VERGQATLAIPEDWLQGRSAFGGLQAALALQAMRTLVPADMPLRTLQMTFLAPVPAGPARARATLLRAGRSTMQVEARLSGGGELQAVVVGVFGAARASRIAHAPRSAPVEVPAPRLLPFLPGISASFMQHFRAHWLHGCMPFSGSTATACVVELTMREEGPASESHVLAFADFIPPVAFSRFESPVAGSSATWMLELLADRFDDLPLQGWRVEAELLAARDGYTSQSTVLWSPAGDAVALSHQTMVVFG